jgi:hypothetical protein
MNKSTAETPLIVVFYIEVGDMESSDVSQFIQSMIDRVNQDESQEKIVKYFIPTRYEPHSRIECINPKVIGEDEFAKVANAMDKLNAIMAEFQPKESTEE